MLPALLTALVATATDAPEASVLALDAYRLEAHLGALPSAGTTSALLEMVVHPAIPLTEDAGGFGALDPERISLLGLSWTWTHWRIAGHDVTDPLAPGSALVHLPFAWTRALEVSMTSRPEEAAPSGIGLVPELALTGVRAGVRAALPDAGGTFPGAEGLMGALSGKHSFDRGVPPPEERRRFRSALWAWAAGGAPLGDGHLTVAAEVTDTTRRFLDFSPTDGGLARTHDEPAARVSAGAAWARGDTHLLVLAEHRARDALGLEAGLSLDEAMIADHDAVLLGLAIGELSASVTLARSRLEARVRSATRELADPDGEASAPWVPDGDRLVLAADAAWSHGPYYARAHESLAWWRPQNRAWTNYLTVAGAPYGRIDWTAADTFVALGEARAGVAEALALGAGLVLRWDLYGWAAHAANGRGDHSLLQVDLGADLSLSGRFGDLTPFALASKSPIAPTGAVALALAPEHLEGRLTVGGTVLDTWGGTRLEVDPQLLPTNVYTGALGLAWRLGEAWTLRAQALVQAIDHSPWIEGGSYYVEDGVTYLSPGEKTYQLTHLDRDPPIYFGGQLQLLGVDTQDYLLNVSFAVYNVVGRTPPGNGPLANDPGVIDHATASGAGALANTDADRAFLTKIVAGRRLHDRLWGFVTARHRDGQPFAFTAVARSRGGQAALVPASPRGSPFVYTRPLAGPREDFRLDLDVQLTWSQPLDGGELRLSLMVANLLDLGNELAEVQIGAARAGRGALESQIPRSILVGLELLSGGW